VSIVLDIHAGNEIITATPEHPFWVAGEGWLEAGHLVCGQQLRTKDGKLIRIESVQRREGRFRVYNFEVANAHTYFVGKTSILVHNAPECFAKIKPWEWKEAKEWAKIDVRKVQDRVRDETGGFESGRHTEFAKGMVDAIEEMIQKAITDEMVPEYVDQLRSSQDTFRTRAQGGHRGGISGRGRRN
jgi:Pretoxin HINT domain